MNIGDVNSNERGSGARFNDGKVALEFIPARILASFYAGAGFVDDNGKDTDHATTPARAFEILSAIGDFEEREEDDDDALILALRYSIPPNGFGVERWRQSASVFAYGATKYTEWNWAKGMPWSVPLACIKRHTIAILEAGGADELYDQESGISHFGHVAANIVMLLHYVRYFQEGDDRAPDECFGGVSGSRVAAPIVINQPQAGYATSPDDGLGIGIGCEGTMGRGFY